jgi:hypothetical protein
MKKLLSALCLCIAMFAVVPNASISAAGTISGNDYTLSYEVIGGNMTITGLEAEVPVDVIIPNEIDGYLVTSIGESAFSGCTYLTTIDLPDNLKSIGKNAFSGTNLTSVTIPKYLTSVGYDTYYKESPFVNSKLSSVTIEDGMVTIPGYLFAQCSTLTKITIPDSVTEIGANAFNGCKLTEAGITFSDNLKIIGGSVFRGNDFKSLTLPDTITSIGDNAFNGCTYLTSIDLPDSLTFIGEYAFSGTSLSTVTIPKYLTSIGYDSYYKESPFFNSKLSSATIEDGMVTIPSYLFAQCSTLTKITIPDSVTEIGANAFNGCDDLTIYGFAGSYAETYANENNIPFAEVSEIPTKPTTPDKIQGDLDGDEEISIVDIVIVAKIVLNHETETLTADVIISADLSNDNIVNSIDLSIIKYLLLKK